MKSKVKYLFILLLTALVGGCGSAPNSPLVKNQNNSVLHDGSGGSAKLIVRNSSSADSEKEYGAIKTYKVTVSGEGISEPIIAEFDGSAEGGQIDGIPQGDSRAVTVEAINKRDKKIREGETKDVVVSGGNVTEVDVEMDAVPIFTNLDDGRTVPSNRLGLEMFADPEDPLEVVAEVGENSSVLTDLATSESEVYPDVATGLAFMRPASISEGEHTFVVRSKRTGKFSSVTIKVIDGSKIKPAPLYSGGFVQAAGDYVDVGRVGSFMHAPSNSGALWPNVLGTTLTELK